MDAHSGPAVAHGPDAPHAPVPVLAPAVPAGAATGTALDTAPRAAVLLPDVDTHTRPLLLIPPARPPHQSARTGFLAPAGGRGGAAAERLGGYVRQINLIQVICWQLAVITVLLAADQQLPVLIVTSVCAGVLVALTTLRISGRWLYQVAMLGVGYLGRARRRDLPDGGTKTLALLGMLLPDSTIRNVDTTYGQAMAISHAGGLTAMLRPESVTPEMLSTLPMPATLLPTSEGQQHAYGVQAVFHIGVRADRPRKVWVAVHATRTVETAGDDELTLALRNAVRRVRRALARAGVPAEPLADEPALASIAGLAHVTGGRNEVREEWRFWRTGTVCQSTYWLTGWDRLGEAHSRMLVSSLLAGVPGVAVTVTVNARSYRDGARVDAVLRLATTSEAVLEAAASTMKDRLVPAGVRLARLDGAHQSGVAASLPIGVFLS